LLVLSRNKNEIKRKNNKNLVINVFLLCFISMVRGNG
jgi:hypothetical protein